MRRILSFCLSLLLTVVCLQAQDKNLKDSYLTNELFNKNLSNWMKFYELTIDDFQFILTCKFSLEEDTSSIYNRIFGEDELLYDSILNDYSPNKSKFVSLLPAKGVYFNKAKKEYYYTGGDDCEEIFYIDLDIKNIKMIQFNGSNQYTEDVIWLNDNSFALVSIDLSDETICIINMYTILKDDNEAKYQKYQTKKRTTEAKNYFQDIILKERNIKEEEYD